MDQTASSTFLQQYHSYTLHICVRTCTVLWLEGRTAGREEAEAVFLLRRERCLDRDLLTVSLNRERERESERERVGVREGATGLAI